MTDGFLGFGAKHLTATPTSGSTPLPTGDRPRRFLNVVAQLVDDRGWVSKGDAFRSGHPEDATAVVAYDVVDQGLAFPVTDENVAVAERALRWFAAEGRYEDSEFVERVAQAADSRMLTPSTASFLAPLVMMYLRAEGRKAQDAVRKEQAKDLTHVGTVGQRGTYSLTLDSVREWVGGYGVTFFYKFSDPSGNVVVWPASSYQGLRVGDRYTVTGTVKKHGDFRGLPETTLTRCKVEPVRVEETAAAAA